MEPIVESCAGLDVHQESVVACVLWGPLEKKPKAELRKFGTTTAELLALAEWLTERGVEVVGMESTGVFWKPVVRHEAPCIRVGRKESHLRPVAAGR